jgi:hypothetical protein
MTGCAPAGAAALTHFEEMEGELRYGPYAETYVLSSSMMNALGRRS